jgi:hypothetical protein
MPYFDNLEISKPHSSIGACCHWLLEPTGQNHLVADGIKKTGTLLVTLNRVMIACFERLFLGHSLGGRLRHYEKAAALTADQTERRRLRLWC